MRVLVTGITGLVGSAIGTHLATTGHEVVGLSRRSGSSGIIPAVLGSLGDESFVQDLLRSTPACDAIVHAAASLDKRVDSPSISMTNCLGAQQTIEIARHWGGAPIVYISSIAVIGTPRILPITEDHPVAPPTSYHASKLFGEHVMNVASDGGIPTVSLRITAPIGQAMPPTRILTVFLRRALEGEPLELAGRGTRRQDYVEVRDVASAVAACLANRDVCGVLNIGSGHSISNLDLAKLCIRVCDSRSEIRFSGSTDQEEGLAWDVSIQRARKTIGYSPLQTLEGSVRTLMDAYARGYSQ